MFEPEDTSMYAGVIYGLHNGDFDIRYVGKTITPLKRRFSGHISDAKRRGNVPVYNWIRKNGADNIQVCVIETFDTNTVHMIDEREIFHIARARENSIGENLNLSDGGGGPIGYRHSDESRAKMSASQTGRVLPAEVRAKISAAAMGNQRTLGMKHTDESKAKMSIALSAAKRGKSPVVNHTRWHVNRSIVKEGCTFC